MDSQPNHFRVLAQMLSGGNVDRDPVRPLLAMLIDVTGLQCVYVNRVDEAQDRFLVEVSQGSDAQGVIVPEGLEIRWSESLCKSVFASGVNYTNQAELLWSANPNVRTLGIHTYVGQPIKDRHGAILGTLCAASREKVSVPASALTVVELFTHLLALQIEHERAVKSARETFEVDGAHAIADAVAHALDKPELEKQLERAFRMSPWDMR